MTHNGTYEKSDTESIRHRSDTYRLLSELYTEPGRGFLDGLDNLGTGVACLDAERLRSATCDPEELRRDYAQLFVGPFEVTAPPYGSTYLDNPDRVMTESTVAATEWYNREGLDVGLDEPPDHVAAELEFVGVLALAEYEEAATGNTDAAVGWAQKQYEFLSQHLGRWISEFTANVREHARTDFYRVLADETQSFVESEAQRLAGTVESVHGSHH